MLVVKDSALAETAPRIFWRAFQALSLVDPQIKLVVRYRKFSVWLYREVTDDVVLFAWYWSSALVFER
jgi:hypothetical protein